MKPHRASLAIIITIIANANGICISMFNSIGNWVKLSGTRTMTLNNQPLTHIPTPWIEREGHAVVTYDDRIFFVLGGQIRSETSGYGQDLLDEVWKAQVSWPLFRIITERSIFDEGLSSPVFQSTLSWERVISHGKKWSKRAHHGSITFKGQLFILGGLALDDFDTLKNEQKTRLMNDIWVSEDLGKTWKLHNVGCQYKLLEERTLFTDTCETDSNCLENFYCFKDVFSKNGYGSCKCSLWEPRMMHSVTVVNNKMYISGGVSSVERQKCGSNLCPEDKYQSLCDIWSSQNGRDWQKETELSGLGLRHKLFWKNNQLSFVNIETNYPVCNQDASSTELNSRKYHQLLTSTSMNLSVNGDFKGNLVESCDDGVIKVLENGRFSILSKDRQEEHIVNPNGMSLFSSISSLESSLSSTQLKLLGKLEINTIYDMLQARSEQIVPLRVAFENLETPFDVCYLKFKAQSVIHTCMEYCFSPEYALNDTHADIKRIVSGQCSYYRDSSFEAKYKQILDTYSEVSIESLMFDEVLRNAQLLNLTADDLSRVLYQSDSYGQEGCDRSRYLEDDVYLLRDEVLQPFMKRVTQGQFDDIDCIRLFNPSKDFKLINLNCEVILIGGVGSNEVYLYDNSVPNTFITKNPLDRSDESFFQVECSEPVCLFQYKLVKNEDKGDIAVVNWTISRGSIDLDNILREFGSGYYSFSVRAFDPSLNVDIEYQQDRNFITWYYSKPISGWRVLLVILLSVAVIYFIVYQRNKRERQKEMKRFAEKKLKRRFKNLDQRGKIKKNETTNELIQRRKPATIITSPISSPQSSKVSPTSEGNDIVNFEVSQKKRK